MRISITAPVFILLSACILQVGARPLPSSQNSVNLFKRNVDETIARFTKAGLDVTDDLLREVQELAKFNTKAETALKGYRKLNLNNAEAARKASAEAKGAADGPIVKNILATGQASDADKATLTKVLNDGLHPSHALAMEANSKLDSVVVADYFAGGRSAQNEARYKAIMSNPLDPSYDTVSALSKVKAGTATADQEIEVEELASTDGPWRTVAKQVRTKWMPSGGSPKVGTPETRVRMGTPKTAPKMETPDAGTPSAGTPETKPKSNPQGWVKVSSPSTPKTQPLGSSQPL